MSSSSSTHQLVTPLAPSHRSLVTLAAAAAGTAMLAGIWCYKRQHRCAILDEDYPLDGLSDADLRKRIMVQEKKAKRYGSLVSVPTTEQFVGGGWVKVAESLKWKPKGSSATKRNPFLPPYEPGLCVGDLEETGHRLLLNKYAVMPGHLLVVTKLYFNQNDSLTWADLKAVHRVLEALGDKAVAFFNHGPQSGFSQGHRHIQIVPNVEYPLEEDYREGAQLGFKYTTRPTATVDAIDSALSELGLTWSPDSSFNMLWTLNGPLVVIPRSRDETKEGGVGINGVGFTGSLFVKTASQLNTSVELVKHREYSLQSINLRWSVVDLIGMEIEQQMGQVPLPRFGHTCTLIGEARVVLFGGATGDTGRYNITDDTYVLNVESNVWKRIDMRKDYSSPTPSPRAAHAAVCVDHMQLVVFGGATGGGSLSNDDLYLLDYRNEDRPEWVAIPVGKGPTPGKRYGHTMVFHKPVLIVYGGNNGTETLSDVWILDVDRSPFLWNKVEPVGGGKPSPLPRAYHSADVCREGPATGMMVVFGGRTGDNQSLSDAWGLRQHRDGRWDWVEAPTKKGEPPEPRFQHVAVFAHTKLIIVGGRSGDVSRSLATCVYDTEQCEWREIPSVERFRHATWMLGPLLFSYGGFNHVHPSAPTNDLQLLDIERAMGLVLPRAAVPPQPPPTVIPEQQQHQRAAAGNNYDSVMADARPQQMDYSYQGAPRPPSSGRSSQSPSVLRETLEQQSKSGIWSQIGAPALADKVYIASDRDASSTVHQIGLDALGEESKRIRPPGSRPTVTPTRARPSDEGSLHHFVIEQLLRPDSWQPDVDPNRFLLQPSEVRQLCKSVLQLLRKQPMVLKLRAPIKVYGDIHGQFLDLMRLFQSLLRLLHFSVSSPPMLSVEAYAAPTDGPGGDIDAMDYLFLGDYVDRGSFSLETICLLFALKIKYPNQIHLIRGNHEDPAINSTYGFRDECKRRLRDDVDNDPNCSWAWFNKVFEWLPCGAVIEDRILCIHGGIGGSIDKVEQIAKLERPLVVEQTPMTAVDQQVTDLLWSDPTDSDDIYGVTSNETRDPDGSGHIVKFGPDRVVQFLEENAPLTMIIRAHECVMDGFERFADGRLITLFSATDYCGHHKNAGALLFIRRDLTIVPKLIYPVDRASLGFGAHDTPPPQGAGMQRLQRMQPNWDASITSARPPTPPRPSREAHTPPGMHPFSHNHPQEAIPLPAATAAWT